MLCKPINEICKSYVINRQTFYRKKEKFKKDFNCDIDLIRKNNKACIEYAIKHIDNMFIYSKYADIDTEIYFNNMRSYFINELQEVLTKHYNDNIKKLDMKAHDKTICKAFNITLKELKQKRKAGINI